MVITPVVDAPEVLAEAEVDEELDEAVEYGVATAVLTLPPETDGVAADGVKVGAPRTHENIHNSNSLDSMAAARVDFWRETR
jgi:hypothetical protein